MQQQSKVQVYYLPNGIRLILNPINGVEATGIGIYVGAGSVSETPQIMGYSHLLEHMVFKGTKNRDYISINKDIEKYGGYLNAFTDKHFTCFYAKILGEFSLQALDVLVDMVTNPIFPNEELEKEKRVILEEISMYEDSPDESLGDLFFEHFYPQSFLGWSILGTKEIISSINQQNLASYWKENYYSGNMIISLTGKFDSQKVIEYVSKIENTGTLQKKDIPHTPVFYGANYKEKDVEQVHLALGVEVFSLFDSKKHALVLLNNILGAGSFSRLYLNIREKLGLCYSISSLLSLDAKTGLLGILTATQLDNLEKMLDAVFLEFKNLKNIPPTLEELEIALAQTKSQILFQRGNVSFHMQKNATDLFWFNKVIPEEEVLQQFEKVKLQDFQDLYQEFFSKIDKFSIFAILPKGKKSKIKKILK